MQTDGIVKTMDVFRNRSMRLLFCRIRFGRFLRLQRREEALRHRIIPAIALATHAGHHAEGVESTAKIIAGVLTATI